jgi:hypothetical protein
MQITIQNKYAGCQSALKRNQIQLITRVDKNRDKHVDKKED